jgi:hypothetical protein
VLTTTDLLFLSGWNRKASIVEAEITRTQPATMIDEKISGLLEAFYFWTDDYTTTVTIAIDRATKVVQVLDVYLAGYTQPNNQMPYVSVWDPEGGTTGNFVVAWNPAILEPVHEHITVTAQLGSGSTQTVAKAYAQLLMVNVYDREAFMESARALFGNVLPGPTATVQPPSPQPQQEEAPQEQQEAPQAPPVAVRPATARKWLRYVP